MAGWQGKITYASGDVYTGEMMDGRFDGDVGPLP